MNEVVPPNEPIGRERYTRLIAAARRETTIKVAVAHPCDDVSLRGAVEAHELGLIDPILVAPPDRLRKTAEDAGVAIGEFEIVASAHSHDSAAKAVGLITAGRVEALMKGALHTDELMGAVVTREGGTHRAPDQSLLHHGRAGTSGAAHHHRRGREYHPGSGRQG